MFMQLRTQLLIVAGSFGKRRDRKQDDESLRYKLRSNDYYSAEKLYLYVGPKGGGRGEPL